MTMVAEVDPFLSDEPLPACADVVIIGGGIVGVSTAFALARKHVAVVLCEKGRIGAEQSCRNWGWVRTMGRDLAEIPLSIAAHRLWQQMEAEHGVRSGYCRTGTLYLCDDEADLAARAAWLEQARGFQLSSRLLSSNDVAALFPDSPRRWAGALHTPDDGKAEPRHAAPAIADAARRLGARIFTGCAVRGVETQAGGISAVVTEHGRIACGTVVLAGGAWSRLFCGNLGLDFPQLKVLGSVLRTQPLEGRPLEGLPDCTVGARNFSFRKRLDGGYTIAHRSASVVPLVPDSFRLFRQFLPTYRRQHRELRLRLTAAFLDEARTPSRWSLEQPSPFERVRVLDPAPWPAILREAQEHLVRAFPGFGRMVVADSWAGLIDVTPDALPVISPVAALTGFFLASGFSGHGFGIAPGAGQLMADLVRGDPPIVDPSPFCFERFARAVSH